MRLSFATTNPIKIDSVMRILKGRGIGIDIVRLDIPEIQADSAQEVAAAKALEAYRNLASPVLVNDFAVHFPALGGFPGTFVKQVTERIGLEGYLRLLHRTDALRGLPDFGCALTSVLAYMDPSMEAASEAPKLFERVTRGVVSPDAYRLLPRKPKGKELVMDIFVPEGETLSLGQMPPERVDRWRKRPMHERHYHELADWLIARAS